MHCAPSNSPRAERVVAAAGSFHASKSLHGDADKLCCVDSWIKHTVDTAAAETL